MTVVCDVPARRQARALTRHRRPLQQGETALHSAARDDLLEIANTLVAHRADLNAMDKVPRALPRLPARSPAPACRFVQPLGFYSQICLPGPCGNVGAIKPVWLVTLNPGAGPRAPQYRETPLHYAAEYKS